MSNWNGEGLPKVGTLARTHDGGGTVEAATVEQVCIRVGRSFYLYPTEQVVPIQTKEEIEKKETIDALIKDIKADQWAFAEDLAERLIDKGYHNGNKTKPLPSDWKNRANMSNFCYYQWIIDYYGIEIEGKE